MADADLNLIMKARDLATGAIDSVSKSLGKVSSDATTTGGRFGALGRIFDAIPFGGVVHGLVDLLMDSKPVRDIMEKVGKVIGEKLAPAMEKVTAWVNDHLIPALSKLIDWLWQGGKGPLAVALDGASKAFGFIVDAIGFVIGKIGDMIGAIRDAIQWLKDLNVYQQHTAEESIAYHTGQKLPGHASGGWVGLHGPELGMLGERGPEYVSSNREVQAGGSPDFELVAVSKRDLARMVDEQLYFTLRRAAPTSGRV